MTSPVMISFRLSPPKPGPYVRNLILRDRVGDDCYWKVTETERGHHIQAARGRYEGWYLDYLLEANVLERNRCWGEATRRDDPTPPLLK